MSRVFSACLLETSLPLVGFTLCYLTAFMAHAVLPHGLHAVLLHGLHTVLPLLAPFMGSCGFGSSIVSIYSSFSYIARVSAFTFTFFPPPYREEDFRASVEAHFTWPDRNPTPYISLFSDPRHAENWALQRDSSVKLLRIDTRLMPESCFFQLAELVRMLNLKIPKGADTHIPRAYLALHQIPDSAIVHVMNHAQIQNGEASSHLAASVVPSTVPHERAWIQRVLKYPPLRHTDFVDELSGTVGASKVVSGPNKMEVVPEHAQGVNQIFLEDYTREEEATKPAPKKTGIVRRRVRRVKPALDVESVLTEELAKYLDTCAHYVSAAGEDNPATRHGASFVGNSIRYAMDRGTVSSPTVLKIVQSAEKDLEERSTTPAGSLGVETGSTAEGCLLPELLERLMLREDSE